MAVEPDDLLLTDRVVAVTGAAVGIGAAIAETAARFGADLLLCDRDQAGLVATAERIVSDTGRRVEHRQLDVRDESAVRAWVEGGADAFGRLDAVVNNAGGGFQALVADIGAGGRAALIDENFTSAFVVAQAARPHLRPGSVLVNITTVEAHRAAPGFAVYAAMKAGLANLTRSLAVEWGGDGIRVVAVAPDLISTPGTGDMPAGAPLARRGTADDVAAVVVFCCGAGAAFVTGSTVHVDGGTGAAGGWTRGRDGTFAPAHSLHSVDEGDQRR